MLIHAIPHRKLLVGIVAAAAALVMILVYAVIPAENLSPRLWYIQPRTNVMSEAVPDTRVTTNWTKMRKILKINAHPKCGGSGFKVDLHSGGDQMHSWAEGSLPFPQELTLPDPEPTDPHFASVNADLRCYKKGTNLGETMASADRSNASAACSCRRGYHGDDCGVPSPVWHSKDFQQLVLPYLSVRATARRIIQAIPVNHEMDLASIRLHELGDAVTATLFSESDFTSAGELKDRFFEKRAREDPFFLGPYRNKTILLRDNTFPPEGCQDGWVALRVMRSFVGEEGLPRLHGLNNDDFLLLFDADEIPRRDVLEFLRLYEGYGEPVNLRMRWYVFGFFWETLNSQTGKAAPTVVSVGCSIGMLRQVYGGQVNAVRHEAWQNEAKDAARAYERTTGRRLRTFQIGSEEHPGGYHCSWCFRDVEGLQVKLVSAQLADEPRWGNYEDRLEPGYLQRMVSDGKWFSGPANPFAPRRLDQELQLRGHEDFAPTYLLRHLDEYAYLLVNPSMRENATIMDEYRRAVRLALLGEGGESD